jgi:ATP/maltotriose-dependent transcriptional regulator MalT
MGGLGFFALAASAQVTQEPEAVRAAEECLMLARKLKKPYYKFLALSALAEIEMRRGNIASGEAYLAETTKGGGFVSAIALYQGGRLMVYYAHDPAKALQYLEKSRRLFVALENEHFIVACNSQIAHIQRLAGDIDTAEAAYRETLAHFHWEGNRSAVAHELECLAFIAQARHVPQRAARLFGAAEALRELVEATMLPHEQEEYDQAQVTLRQELDAGTFQQAWSTGRAMEVDRAVDYALS